MRRLLRSHFASAVLGGLIVAGAFLAFGAARRGTTQTATEVGPVGAQLASSSASPLTAHEIYVNSAPTSYDELEGVLRGLVSARPDIPVVLEGDREVLFGDAVKILSAAQRAGATQVAIAAERRTGS